MNHTPRIFLCIDCKTGRVTRWKQRQFQMRMVRDLFAELGPESVGTTGMGLIKPQLELFRATGCAT